MASMIRCLHHTQGCKWVDQLKNLATHLEVCMYDSIVCPNNCSVQLSRGLLEEHLEYSCPLRKEKCEFCKLEFSGDTMENHRGACPMEVTWCENKCGARLQRRFLNNHMKSECHKRTAPCHYCHKEFVFETLQDHYYQCPRFLVMCPNRCDPLKIPREELEKHVLNDCPSAHIPCVFKDAGCKYMCPRFHLDKHLEDATKLHLSLLGRLVVDQDSMIKALTQQIRTLSHVTDGTFIWKIPAIKSKLSEAKSKPNVELKSDLFYTSRYGYCLRASVFLNGNGSGEDTHMSLYIRMVSGEYDTLLDWPFRQPISFQLLDQCSDPEKRQTITESFTPNPAWKQFQQPNMDSDSMGFGYPKFINLEMLRAGTYIRDDSLYVKIVVDTGSTKNNNVLKDRHVLADRNILLNSVAEHRNIKLETNKYIIQK